MIEFRAGGKNYEKTCPAEAVVIGGRIDVVGAGSNESRGLSATISGMVDVHRAVSCTGNRDYVAGFGAGSVVMGGTVQYAGTRGVETAGSWRKTVGISDVAGRATSSGAIDKTSFPGTTVDCEANVPGSM